MDGDFSYTDRSIIFIKNEPFRFPFPLDNTMLPEKYEQYDIIGEKEC